MYDLILLPLFSHILLLYFRFDLFSVCHFMLTSLYLTAKSSAINRKREGNRLPSAKSMKPQLKITPL